MGAGQMSAMVVLGGARVQGRGQMSGRRFHHVSYLFIACQNHLNAARASTTMQRLMGVTPVPAAPPPPPPDPVPAVS